MDIDYCTGNFKSEAKRLRSLREKIIRCMKSGTPILSTSLGMHLLFEKSREAVDKGLRLLGGECLRLLEDVKIPHTSWNNLHIIFNNELLNGIDEKDYFVHGYYVKPEDTNIVATEIKYRIRFTSAIAKENIYEKSSFIRKSQEAWLEDTNELR